jgi:uncharacterized membrane protein YphA (DoxX/SURF4 family)
MRDPISDLFHFLTFRPLWYGDGPAPTRWGPLPIILFWLLAAGAVAIAAQVWRTDRSQRRPRNVYFASTRFLLGVMWFQATLWKLPPTFTGNPDGSGGLRKWTEMIADHAAYGFHRALFRDVILANFEFFAYQVWAIETAIAVSLMLGFLTRLGGLLGVVMSLNLWLGLYNAPNEWSWTYVFMALLMGMTVALRAGRVLGADALLAPKLQPKSVRLRRLRELAT